MLKKFLFLLLLIIISIPVLSQKKKGTIQPFKEKGLWGVKSGKKTKVVPAIYDTLWIADKLITAIDTSGKYSILSETGISLFTQKFDSISPFIRSETIAFFDKKSGIVSKDGKILADFIYKKIDFDSAQRQYKATSYNKFLLSSGQKVIQTYYLDNIQILSDSLFSFLENGSWGIIELNGRIISPPQFSDIRREKNFILACSGKKKALLDLKGEMVEVNFDSLIHDPSGYIRTLKFKENKISWGFSDSLGNRINKSPYNELDSITLKKPVRFKRGHLYGFINEKAEEIIEAKYTAASPFLNGKSSVQINEKYGVIDTSANWILPPYADKIDHYFADLFRYEINGKTVYIDDIGFEKYCGQSKTRLLPDQTIEIMEKGKVGRLNSSGEEILPPVYDSIFFMNEEKVIPAFKEGAVGLFNSKGDTVEKPGGRLNEYLFTSENFMGVKILGKYGFIDKRGRIRIANRYDGIKPFSDGMAAVKVIGKWGYIDKAEILKVQPYYEETLPFKNGIAVVGNNGMYGLIDKKGTETVPLEYNKIERRADERTILYKNGKIGMANAEGYITIYAKYQQLSPQSDGNVIVENLGKFGVVTSKDQILIPFLYDEIRFNPYSGNYILILKGKEEIFKF